jgi:hypothetical protein
MKDAVDIQLIINNRDITDTICGGLQWGFCTPGMIMTAKDIPGSHIIGVIERDQPALVAVGGEGRSITDPIAAFFAETSSKARAAWKSFIPLKPSLTIGSRCPKS